MKYTHPLPISLPQQTIILPQQTITVDVRSENIRGDITADKLTDELAAEMQIQIDRSIIRILKYNNMCDDDIINVIQNDKSVFEILANPSDKVIDAYKFLHEL